MKVLTFVAILVSSTVAYAEETPFEVSGNVALTSDYRFRGLEQTDGGPAVQGGFDVEYNGLYAGVWGSNVELGGDGSIELDYYGGYMFDLKGVTIDVGYIYYDYPQNGDVSDDFDYAETYVSASLAGFTVGYAYSDDFFGNAGTAEYTYVDYGYELPYGVDLGLHVGHSSISSQSYFANGEEDYTDFSVGVSKDFYGVNVGVSYVGTNLDAQPSDGSDSYADDSFVFTVSKSL
jgi:uncharacterized protein (TIGR02001 family)